MSFRPYEHLERHDSGHPAVAGIKLGTVHFMSKLDGTNASVWVDEDGLLCCGSRNRELSADADNHGFFTWLFGPSTEAQELRAFASLLGPRFIVYGEWLVHHTIHYRPEAMRKFYVYDVFDRTHERYVDPSAWWNEEALGGPLRVPRASTLAIIENPTDADILRVLGQSSQLMPDGELGEGVVLKNYEWQGPGKVWAKVVRSEFKDKHRDKRPATVTPGSFNVEVEIAKRVTLAFVEKTRAKIRLAMGMPATPTLAEVKAWETLNRGRLIPRLIETVWHEFLVEELPQAVKDMNGPTINTRELRHAVMATTKALAGDLFQ